MFFKILRPCAAATCLGSVLTRHVGRAAGSPSGFLSEVACCPLASLLGMSKPTCSLAYSADW